MLLDQMTVNVDFNGIVIFSYPGIERQFGGQIKSGENILKSFVETDLGDAVLDAGYVVPIVNMDDGGYLVRFFDAPVEPSPNREVVFSDEGYVLSIEECLYVADAAVFWDWEEFLGWRKVKVECGKYAVTVQGVLHLGANGGVDRAGYDVVLTRRNILPKRTAVVRGDSRVLS